MQHHAQPKVILIYNNFSFTEIEALGGLWGTQLFSVRVAFDILGSDMSLIFSIIVPLLALRKQFVPFTYCGVTKHPVGHKITNINCYYLVWFLGLAGFNWVVCTWGLCGCSQMVARVGVILKAF